VPIGTSPKAPFETLKLKALTPVPVKETLAKSRSCAATVQIAVLVATAEGSRITVNVHSLPAPTAVPVHMSFETVKFSWVVLTLSTSADVSPRLTTTNCWAFC
jgi:hypothetical protein